MGDLYGKCLNLNCRSNCQKFAAKVSRGSICEQVRCLNCDCFEYQHDWVARWDPQLLSHVYISSRNTPTSSIASAPHFTSTTTQPDNRKISGVNEELHSLYVPSTNRHSSSSTSSAPSFRSPPSAEYVSAEKSTLRARGGNSCSKQKESSRSQSITKKPKLETANSLVLFILKENVFAAPVLSLDRSFLAKKGQFFESFPYILHDGTIISQPAFEDYIRDSHIFASFISAFWQYTFYYQHGKKKMVPASNLSSLDFPDAETWKALADDCAKKGMVVICKPKGPSFDPVAGDEEEVASVQGKLFFY
jgi:hypothetical protein